MNAADFAPVVSMVDDVRKQGSHGFRANLLISVATLELLIAKKIITTEEAVERIEAVRNRFITLFGDQSVGLGASWAIDLLHGHTPLHGSPLEQAMQAKERGDSSK